VGRNKEVNVATANDKQVFLRDPDQFIRHFEQVFGEWQYRPRINTRHVFSFQWLEERVADTVRMRNPVYFPKGQSRIRYPRLQYTLNYQRVDYLPYPSKGPLAQLQIARSGLGSSVSMWEVHAKAMMHWPIDRKWSWAWGAYAGWKSPSTQPFVNRRFLGYGTQFLSGYEYNVVDGVAGGLTRVLLTREWIRHTIRIHHHKSKEPWRIPIRLMSRAFLQAGYVHDPEVPPGGRLANQWQYSGGLGLDLLFFYDVLFRLEYSVNRFGENGLFLHRKYPF
jgi:outer membrane protein assembly factor BamA